MVRLILLLFFFSPPVLIAQPPESTADIGLLRWNEYYRLQWEDFQGLPDENSLGDAGTAVHIKAKPFLVRREIQYDVDAFFNRKESWVRDKSPSLLAHEQLHFDIAEMYARKIRKAVGELRQRGVKDIKTFNAAIHNLLEESNHVDAQYDLETLHGALSRKQQVWSDNIKRQMRRLHKYRKTKRVIGAG